MIKLVIFDLDGVLYDSKEIHYESLNLALKNIDSKYMIFRGTFNIFDGLPTSRKLELLTELKHYLKINIKKFGKTNKNILLGYLVKLKKISSL